MQDLSCLALQRVSAKMVVCFLNFSETREDFVHLFGTTRICHSMLERFEFVVQVTHTSAPGDRLVKHRASGHFLDVLAKVTDSELFREGDVTIVRLLFAD